MAARKKTAKAEKAPKRAYTKRSNGSAAEEGPEGFTKVESAHIAGFWIPSFKGQSIRGVVQDFTTKTGIDGKPNVWANFLITDDNVGGDVMGQEPGTKRKRKVEVGSGMIVGLSGAVLLSRLRGREGKEVFIRYAGLGERVKGKHQARLYDVFERSA